MTPRRSPYTWATWVTGLLAGDDQCQYAAWVKSHFTYEKRVRGDDFDLATWKAQHAVMVSERAAQLTAYGWSVSVEDQTKFPVRGAATTLAGQPDIVATKGDGVLVSDEKSGQRRAKDIWQVLLYIFTRPLSHPELVEGKRLMGEVVYRDGVLPIAGGEFTDGHRARIVGVLQVVGGPIDTPPAATPSARECAFCDIAACQFRVHAMATEPRAVEAF
jgi:hypothetical protein